MKRVTNTEKDPQPRWLMGGNPNAILAQEAQGQKELIESDQLPADSDGLNTALMYEVMGIKVIGNTPGDDLFLDVVLPPGWKKEQTEHSMWSLLKDHKGRVRARFFYKAAFYDRKARIRFENRYQVETEYLDEVSPKNDWDKARYYIVKDTATDQILFTGKKSFYEDNESALKIAEGWLTEHYPNWKIHSEYWD